MAAQTRTRVRRALIGKAREAALNAVQIFNNRAAMAVARSILVIAWHLLTDDADHEDLGGDHFTRRDTDRARQRALAHQLVDDAFSPRASSQPWTLERSPIAVSDTE